MSRGGRACLIGFRAWLTPWLNLATGLHHAGPSFPLTCRNFYEAIAVGFAVPDIERGLKRMKRLRLFALFAIAAGLTALFLSNQAPSALMKSDETESRQRTLRKPDDILVKEFLREITKNVQPGSILRPDAQIIEEGSDDPDLPPGMAGLIDKEAYLRLRGDYIDMRRGRPAEDADELRAAALRTMEKQQDEERLKAPSFAPFDPVNWNFVGPAPIPLGQTSATRVPVSGRTIAIAVHPTDPDTVYVGTAQGGLYKSTNGGANWTRLFDFQLESLAIGAITIDPNDSGTVYVGTGESNLSADSFAGKGLYIIRNANSPGPALTGPFRLNGAGGNVFSGRSISRIMVPASNNNIIFVSTTTGTGGNPNTSQLNTPRAGLYRSTNGQSPNPTFEQVQITGVPAPNNRNLIDIQLDPGNDNVLIASILGESADGGIYRTADALSASPTFTRTHTLPDGTTNGRAELTATRTSGGVTTFYTATGELNPTFCTGGNATRGGGVRRSTDGGVTWSATLSGSAGFCGGQCFYDIAIAVTPDNQTIHLGGAARSGTTGLCNIDVMKRSTNGGTSFVRNDNTLHADEHALAVSPSNPNVVYTGSDGGIWRSTDNGTSWTSLNNVDFSATQFQGVAVHPFDRNFLMGGTQDNGTNCQNAAGIWSHCRDGDGGYAVIDTNALDTTNVTMYHTFFNQTNSQIGFERASTTAANADGQLSGWTFRGCSGTTSNNGFRCADNVLFYAPVAQGPGNPNTIYFGTDRLYRSTNRGDTMTLASQGPLVPTGAGTSGIVVTAIGISPQDDNVRIVGMRNGRVFATTTGSTTLTEVTGANFPAPNPADVNRNSIGKAVIDPNNPNTAYITFTSFSPPAGQQIFKTTNLGDAVPTWVASSNGIPQVPVSGFAVDPQDSNSLYAGTDIGVYHSPDGGVTWAPLGQGLPRVAVFDVAISNVQRLLRVATHGRGIWEIGIPGRQLAVVRDGGDLSVIAEGCAPGNGVIDAHEDVTVRLPITNIGAGPTQDLTVTLEATGGVTLPGPAVMIPPIPEGGSGFADIAFNAGAECGETITLTFHLQESGMDAGTIVKSYTLGMRIADETAVENFDGVVAPALPAGWTTVRTATGPALWQTSTTAASSTPNSAFGLGSTVAGESSLTSPMLAIPQAPTTGYKRGVQLSFRNSFNTEPGFDGAVLEISVNGGAFADVVTAGGSFASGGYNASIGVTDSSLTGRAAWTGNSGGFITTVVNLPEAAFGQSAQFKWRLASDTGTNPTGGGIRIDTIGLNTISFMCCEGACSLSCPMNITVPNDLDLAGAYVTFQPTYTGQCGQVVSTPASGSFFSIGVTPVTTTATRLDGTFDSCMFDVTVNDTQFPTVSVPTVDKASLWPPEHQMVPVTVDYTATDNDSVTCTLSVSSNEPIDGMGDGDTAPDWVIVDAHHVLLRAERGGKGNGRVYTITVTCVDPSGNTTTRTATVRVPLNQKGSRNKVALRMGR